MTYAFSGSNYPKKKAFILNLHSLGDSLSSRWSKPSRAQWFRLSVDNTRFCEKHLGHSVLVWAQASIRSPPKKTLITKGKIIFMGSNYPWIIYFNFDIFNNTWNVMTLILKLCAHMINKHICLGELNETSARMFTEFSVFVCTLRGNTQWFSVQNQLKCFWILWFCSYSIL